MKHLFVYGTLMRGERAAGMLADGIYKGEYVLDDYAMYDLGSFPGIIEEEGEKVIGEVFEIPDTIIPRLDCYEGEGDLYKRTVVSVKGEDPSIDKALAYVYLGKGKGSIIRTKWNELRK